MLDLLKSDPTAMPYEKMVLKQKEKLRTKYSTFKLAKNV
jgi:hypothetical protein